VCWEGKEPGPSPPEIPGYPFGLIARHIYGGYSGTSGRQGGANTRAKSPACARHEGDAALKIGDTHRATNSGIVTDSKTSRIPSCCAMLSPFPAVVTTAFNNSRPGDLPLATPRRVRPRPVPAGERAACQRARSP
jgi:hypothetical protein